MKVPGIRLFESLAQSDNAGKFRDNLMTMAKGREPHRAKDEYDRAALPLAGESAWISVHGVERELLKKGQAAAS